MLLDDGSMLFCPCIASFGRQHGVAGRTPRTVPRTVAIYKSARLEAIREPSSRDWLIFYASVGTDLEFFCELFRYAIFKGLDASRYAPVAHLARAQPFIYLG